MDKLLINYKVIVFEVENYHVVILEIAKGDQNKGREMLCKRLLGVDGVNLLYCKK